MRILSGHKHMVRSVRFSPSGKWLLTAGGYAYVEARLYDVACGEVYWSYDETPEGYHRGVAVHPSEDQLLTVGHPEGFRAIEIATLREVETPMKDEQYPPQRSPIFSPDGRRFFAMRQDPDEALRFRWTCWTYPKFEFFAALDWYGYWPPAFNADGTLVAYFNHDRVDVYNTESLFYFSMYRQFPCRIQEDWRLALDPDSRFIVAASGKMLTVFDLGSGETVATLKQSRKHFLDASFTPNGKYLATVSNEGTVKMWSTDTWELAKEYEWRIGGLKCIAFSPDGLLAAAGSDKKKIVVWDLED